MLKSPYELRMAAEALRNQLCALNIEEPACQMERQANAIEQVSSCQAASPRPRARQLVNTTSEQNAVDESSEW